MIDTMPDPGSATTEQLKKYWRLPSLRATRELARHLGVRRVARTFPWKSISTAQGLAEPGIKSWDELKLAHVTTADLAALLMLSRRQAQRFDEAKPDPSFPDPLDIRDKPKLWRRAQVVAWMTGSRVPRYKSQPRPKSTSFHKDCPAVSEPPYQGPACAGNIFNPHEILRSADSKNDKMT